ncbi:hypothetical protein ABC766_29495 [Methylobacterium fujisawaense]|uniref:hypothetical protein n=1 Tax=Methylobacterium fujisawaense TaxID=107400 RepID=UPI0031F4D111
MAASRTKAITLAGSPAFHPPGAVDRLAVLRAQQADLAEKRADNAELKARLSAKEAAEDKQAKDCCLVVIGRIQAREAERRERLKLQSPQERYRANQKRKRLRLNPHTERDAAVQLGRRIVTDPTRLGGFVEVQVNKQLDVLTVEHSANRISDQEFAVGRLLQEAWTDNGDSADRRLVRLERLGVTIDGREEEELAPREMGMLREVFRLRAVGKLDEKLAGIVGWIGVRFLKAILVEGHTLKSYASCTVGGGDRGVGRVGDRFRWLLESVTDGLHTAEGARLPTPRDIYSADADTVPARVAALKARAEAAKEAEAEPA